MAAQTPCTLADCFGFGLLSLRATSTESHKVSTSLAFEGIQDSLI